jgi:hypothetical protein
MMRRIIYSFAFIITAQITLSAQSSLPSLQAKCPAIAVECPTEIIQANSPMTFTARVSEAPAHTRLTFNWSVSAGSISSGQGTPAISVDTTGLDNQQLTATVEVGGLTGSCEKVASCTYKHLVRIVCIRPLDSYGDIDFEDEMARLDNFAIELLNSREAQGYLIFYGARRGYVGEVQERMDDAKDYLVNVRDVDRERITTINGGYREELMVELWVVPHGAEPPPINATVSPDEVEIIPEDEELEKP